MLRSTSHHQLCSTHRLIKIFPNSPCFLGYGSYHTSYRLSISETNQNRVLVTLSTKSSSWSLARSPSTRDSECVNYQLHALFVMALFCSLYFGQSILGFDKSISTGFKTVMLLHAQLLVPLLLCMLCTSLAMFSISLLEVCCFRLHFICEHHC